MKNKNSILVFAGLFILLLAMSFTSASVNFVGVSGATQSVYTGNTATVTFKLNQNNTNNVTANVTDIHFFTPLTLTSGTKTLVSSNVSGAITSLNASETSSLMTLTFNVPTNQTLGTYTGTLTFSLSGDSQDYLPISITVKSDKPSEIQDCIITGTPANTDVRIKKIDLNDDGIKVGSSYQSYGDDDSWFPFETINADIEVKNYGSYDVADVEVSWGLWNEDTGQWVIEPDSEKSFNLDHGDTESLSISFQLDNKMDMDLDEIGDGDKLRLYVYLSDGVVDDKDAPSTVDGKSVCAYDSNNAEMIIERDFAVVTDLTYSDSAQCDSTVQVSGTVWNIGDRDQDSVSILVSNSQLGLNKRISLGDINSFDSSDFTVDVPVNSTVSAGTYYLKFMVIDEDGDVFQNDFNDDESVLSSVPLVVTGDCSVSNVLVSASLQSGGQAGKALAVKATIVNSGTKASTYSLNAAGYASWADSAQIDQPIITLNAGESKDVIITLNVKSDASGEELFNLEVLSNSQLVANQPVSVEIESNSGLLSLFNGNWHIWAIGFLNLILVIVIIVVAVRIARK